MGRGKSGGEFFLSPSENTQPFSQGGRLEEAAALRPTEAAASREKSNFGVDLGGGREEEALVVVGQIQN